MQVKFSFLPCWTGRLLCIVQPEIVEWVHVGLTAGIVPACVVGQVVVSLGFFFSVISKDLRSIHVQFWLILNTLSTGSLSCDKPVVWGKSNGHSGEAAALSL